MGTILLIILLAFIGFAGYKIYYKKPIKPHNGKPPKEEKPIIKVPQKKGYFTYNEYTTTDTLKELLKNVTKWNTFKYLYLADDLLYFDKAKTKLAGGIFVVLNEDNKFCNYYSIEEGVIKDSGKLVI